MRSLVRLKLALVSSMVFLSTELGAMVIQAEDYNSGGNGIGYYDSTQFNQGNEYRSDDVDIRAHAGGGYFISNVVKTEWLAYDVNIPTTGYYHLNARVASPSKNRAIHFCKVEISGDVNLTGPMTFSETGTNPTFITVSKLVHLNSGTQTIKACMDEGSLSFDYWELVYDPNVAPVVNAGTDFGLTYPNRSATLSGSVTDDGLPNPPGAMTAKWTQVSGPRQVTFEDPSSPTTNISMGGYDGVYVLRLTAHDGSLEAYDDVTVTVTDTPRVTIPAIIQAENYRDGGEEFAYFDSTEGNSGGLLRSDDVDIEACAEGGYNLTDIAAEEWISFNVVVPQSGYYTLTARVATIEAQRQLHFQVGDVDVSGPITFNSTGGDQIYVDVSAGAFLEKGRHTLKVCMDTSDFNLNYIEVSSQTFASNIVSAGTANAEIVTAVTPTRSAALAAQELRTYIQKISGATLPIVTAPTLAPIKIYVGKSLHTDALSVTDSDLADGAFRIIAGPNYLVLLGKEADYTPITPYATSANNRPLAEGLWDATTGNIWGNPYDSVFERKNSALNIWSKDERGTLNAAYRFLGNLGVRWYFPGAVGEVCPTLTTIGLPKINLTVRPKFALRQFAQPGKQFKTNDAQEPLWQLRLASNDGSEASGHPWAHGMQYLTERELKKENSPEHYAIYNNTPAINACEGAGAPKLSSTGLFLDNVAFIEVLFDHYGEVAVNVTPPDGFTKISETEPDQSFEKPERGEDGRMSDYVFDYVNRVAADLIVDYPARRITTSAYGRYRLPPVDIEEMSPNVALIYVRPPDWLVDHDENAKNRRVIAEWLEKLPSRQLYIWEKYRHANTGDNNAYKGVPAYFPHLIADDIQFMKNRSIGFFTEVFRASTETVWHPLATNHLNVYVASRLYWNPELDVDALMEEYYTGFYGTASEEMKDFVEYCEANWKKVPSDNTIMPAMKALLDLAVTAAGTNNVYAERVELVKNFIDAQYP